jgi:hypothetical protein
MNTRAWLRGPPWSRACLRSGAAATTLPRLQTPTIIRLGHSFGAEGGKDGGLHRQVKCYTFAIKRGPILRLRHEPTVIMASACASYQDSGGGSNEDSGDRRRGLHRERCFRRTCPAGARGSLWTTRGETEADRAKGRALTNDRHSLR